MDQLTQNWLFTLCSLIQGVKRAVAQVLDKLGGVRHQLQILGASHAQRDVFYHLLVHAALKDDREDLRQVFLHDIERLGFCEVPKRAAYKSPTYKSKVL